METEKDPQKMLATADLHFGSYADGDECTRRLAEDVCASDADVFALAGDVAEKELEDLEQCLSLFDGFDGPKFFVPGNHDLWTTGDSSYRKYVRGMPGVAMKCGFHMLDVGPCVAGRTGFVGSVGWYDYSMRRDDLDFSEEDYAKKTLPGIGTWNDMNFVHWDYTDHEFTEYCVRRLSHHYGAIEDRVDSVVAVLHHLPFRELLYGETGDRALELCRAYMGAERLGELLLTWPKLRLCVCGHRHGMDSLEKEGVRSFVVGSTYQMKRLLSLDLSSGEHECREYPPTEPDL